MKKVFTLLSVFIAFSAFSALAQENETVDLKKNQNPVSLNLTTGTAFMTGFNGKNAFSTFLAPQISKPLSKRFAITAGFAIVNTTFSSGNSVMNDSPKKSFSNNYTSTIIYGGGKYLLNERFTLTGLAYTEVGIFDNKKYLNKNKNTNIKGASIGLDYKLSENSSIGIHMNYSNGNSLYNMNNPYGMQMDNPFNNR